MNTTPDFSCDVLIIGSGAAGLSLALRLAEHSSVTVLSKGPISEGSTFYAQGGIAAVFDETDSIESHVEDTLIAGAGLVTGVGRVGNARGKEEGGEQRTHEGEFHPVLQGTAGFRNDRAFKETQGRPKFP